MSTVASRTFNSTPQRDARATWQAVIELLTQGKDGEPRDELLRVAGVASSVIADQAPKDAAIIVTCDGPRTRIYCLYDNDAIDGSEANEDTLGFNPLAGDWRISLPCEPGDLPWVQETLKKYSSRVTARDKSATLSAEDSAAATLPLVLDMKGFLGS